MTLPGDDVVTGGLNPITVVRRKLIDVFGGLGYGHILRDVKDMAIKSGISEKAYTSIVTDNVRNFLA